MKAAMYERYGPPEVMVVREMPVPKPKDNELLLKIHATTVTTTEAYFRQGKPFITRFFTGLTKPKFSMLGEELAGVVEAVGKDVSRFAEGDRVFGTAGPTFGATAEYVCIGEDGVITKIPDGFEFGAAASCVDGFLTSLPFLRDTGEIKDGMDVLIYGASGSVGSSAVQVAKYFGTTVTGVCSGANVELVKSLGADVVVDYTKEDFTKLERRYDLIFDAVGKLSFGKVRRALKADGVFLEAGIVLSILPKVLWSSLFGRQKLKIAATGMRPPAERLKDLKLLAELLKEGKIRPVIDREYSLDEIVEAHRYVDTGRKKGNVVVRV